MPIELKISNEDNAAIVAGWRVTKRNNKDLPRRLCFDCLALGATKDESVFLPRLLVFFGFFESTSQVKKNQPELWREIPQGTIMEQVRLSWADIEIWFEDI